jgi:hypothetical protein
MVSVLLEAAPGWAKQVQQSQSDGSGGEGKVASQDLKGGFGRPETITGTLLMIKYEPGIVVLAVRGSSQQPSTVVVVQRKTANTGDATIREEEVTTVPAPGETDFNFRVDSSTLIKIDGQRVALRELASLKGRQATVRFVARRAGNFALGIEVG